jgi:hypothetical protein
LGGGIFERSLDFFFKKATGVGCYWLLFFGGVLFFCDSAPAARWDMGWVIFGRAPTRAGNLLLV